MTARSTGGRHAGSGVARDEASAAETAIAADIEQARADLGETVEQLADRARAGKRATQAVRRYGVQLSAALIALALAMVAARKLRPVGRRPGHGQRSGPWR
jgi:predicted NBD/HSP70 family sugar kinase